MGLLHGNTEMFLPWHLVPIGTLSKSKAAFSSGTGIAFLCKPIDFVSGRCWLTLSSLEPPGESESTCGDESKPS
jgi:hypothetical protein